MIELLKSARRVSVPILVIRTADQQATAAAIVKAVTNGAVVQWNAVNGMMPSYDPESGKPIKASETQLQRIVSKDGEMPEAFEEAMTAAHKFDQGTVVVVHNAQRQLASSEPRAAAAAIQAVANLRDEFKKNYRTLVLLAPQFTAPQELEQDLVILDHALPTGEELREMLTQLYEGTRKTNPSLPELTTDVMDRAVEAVRGLSLFAAEQQAAMSLRKAGWDIPALWERKRVTIEQTRGLRVWRGEEKFSDIVGLESVKSRLRLRLKARTPIGCVLFLDEIDKVLANVEHDTSGVRMDQLRSMLTEMENNEWRGTCLVGVPGGGKSLLAKALGNEAGVPTVALDLGDMEGPHVGESEAMIRHALQVVKAIGSGNAYVIATSNNASVMRPELQRRFTDGFFFFDVMTDEERRAAWKHYIAKYELEASQTLPDDTGWTGAEIRNCCRDAWDNGISLVDAANFVIPMATSRADDVEALRRYANGRFLDASKPGKYVYSEAPMQQQLRAIALPPDVIDIVKDVPKKHMN